MSSEDQTPLQGIRVLDLSNLFASPTISMYLADFGAEVIKTEHPQRGDELRKWGHLKDGIGTFFKVVNRNKKLVTLNLSKPEGQALVRRMVPEVDVLLSNYRPGTMERWGIGYDVLKALNPRLIMASVSGFGHTGPYASRPGFGTIAESFTGPTHFTGFPDREPLLPQFGLGDATAGLVGSFGVMLALYHRDARGGEGQFIDLALYEGVLNLMGPNVVDYGVLGLVPQRNGNRQTLLAPRNTYQAADGEWIAISGGTQATFARTVEGLGLGHLVDDPRFANNAARVQHVEELDAMIAQAIGAMTQKEALDRLQAAKAVAGPICSIAQVFEDPHIEARENIAFVPDQDFGSVAMQNVIPRLSATPGRIKHTAPGLGADNDAVYGGIFGLSEQEMDELRELEVI